MGLQVCGVPQNTLFSSSNRGPTRFPQNPSFSRSLLATLSYMVADKTTIERKEP